MAWNGAPKRVVGYGVPENWATPWWAAPPMWRNSPPKATRLPVMAASKAPKTPLATGAQLCRVPPEVRSAARWSRGDAPTL